jgi:hypothetical protein
MPGFAGFDRSDYPGAAVMNWLKANTNLKWCGFYLAPAPSHPDTSWMNAAAADLEGWGLAPIYLGQETTGPGSHKVNAAQGAIDGADACRLMIAAGFDPGSVVYLDNEAGPPMLTPMREYVGAWCDAVVAGGFTAGVYCSFLLGAQTKALRPSAKIWAFHVRTVSEHRVPGETFPTPDPSASGFAGANVWQLDDEAILICPLGPNGEIVVDLNSADSADPSAP